MGYWKERLKHAVRFRHKRGYGVHSPFMFNLILNVICDRKKQFQYPLELEQAKLLDHRERKVFHLLSRLIRHLKVHRIVCLGKNATLLADYLAVIYRDASFSDNPTRFLEADFVYLGHQKSADQESLEWNQFLESYPRYVVITDIYKNSGHARLWRQLSPKATVSVDMMWYGLLFFDNKIQQGKYKLII